MTFVLQQSINGLVLGSLYVLVALGLTLIYGVLVQINFAHADIVTLGAFSAYFFVQGFGGGYIPGIAVALVVGGMPAGSSTRRSLRRCRTRATNCCR